MSFPLLKLCYGTGGRIVANILNSLGIEYLFTIAGSQTLPIMHGISKSHTIKIVTSRNERNSVFMAEGYGKVLNLPAVSLSTLGPGIANELPALLSAKKNNSPVLSISPFQPPWKLSRFGEIFQGLNHPEFLRCAVKNNYIVNEIEQLPEIITTAFNQSIEEPKGPVHIDISFPILFKSYLYYIFDRKYINKELLDDLYLIYESPEFKKIYESVFSVNCRISELQPGDATGTLPFSLGVKLGVKESMVVVFVSMKNLFKNLDSLYVSVANGLRPLIISLNKNSQIARIADVFKIEYKENLSRAFLEKSSTMKIVVVD
jgi:thiamine pyrophosphate-dependent acetolactate synthase large subunit-like protein